MQGFPQRGGEQELTLQDVKKKIPAIQRLLNGGQKKIVVIDGPSGPTGKTTAARLLADAGIPVYEEYQVIRITMDEPVQLDLRDADTEALVQELCRRGALRVNTLDRAPYQMQYRLTQTGYGIQEDVKAQTVLAVPPFHYEQ